MALGHIGNGVKERAMHGGQALVTVFERAGIDYIFCSPGTEWPPVWEAMAELKKREAVRPAYINCRHEALAVGMAAAPLLPFRTIAALPKLTAATASKWRMRKKLNPR